MRATYEGRAAAHLEIDAVDDRLERLGRGASEQAHAVIDRIRRDLAALKDYFDITSSRSASIV